MAEYLAPGVFIEDNPSPPVIEAVSSSTGGFVGITQRGVVGKPIFITSWTAFISNFALGMDSPFIANSDLAYSVYGFFQNGGKRCYIARAASSTAKVATMSGDSEIIINAKDEGEWGNKLKVKVVVNEDDETLFDLFVLLNEETVEVWRGVSNDVESETFWLDVIDSQSDFISCKSGTLTALEAQSFSGGNDGVSGITDTDFSDILANFDIVDDVNLLCIPGQTSETLTKALIDYCEGRGDVFPILDAPRASTVESVRTLRKELAGKASLNFPWIRVADPLSRTGKLRDCPLAGHIMGVYARIISERGVWKAPAGTEANVRGAIEVVTTVTKEDLEVLNPAGIVAVIPKTNYGIVVWGARSMNPDSSMRYISDILLDMNIKKSVYNGTQQFVFEPNDSKTWTRVTATVQAFLDGLWRDGALFGDTAKEAYFVKCDEELNPANVRNAGKLICEVGYASKKPSEFVIFRFSHDIASN